MGSASDIRCDYRDKEYIRLDLEIAAAIPLNTYSLNVLRLLGITVLLLIGSQ